MINTIDCNDIQVTVDYLLSKFETCKRLEAADMQLLVNLIQTVNACSVGNLAQDNLFLEVDLGLYAPGTSISSIVNTLPQFTVTETQIALFTAQTTGPASGPNSNRGFLIEEKYVLKLKGKDVYGVGGTQLVDDDFILLNPIQDETARNTTVINNLVQSSRILSGNVTWYGDVSPLDFKSTDIIYTFGGIIYTAPALDPITLSAPDATFSRIDVFAVDVNSGLVVIEGTPSANPEEPVINFETQIRVSSVVVTVAGPDLSDVIIYDENLGQPNEYDAVENTSGLRFDLASIIDPQSGTVSIEADDLNFTGDFLTFTHATNEQVSLITQLTFHIKLASILGSNTIINVQFLKDGLAASNVVAITPNNFGFSLNNVTDQQLIVIPKSTWTFSQTEINGLKISFFNNGLDNRKFYIDNIRLVKGLETVPTTYTFLDLEDTPTSYSGSEGYLVKVKSDGTGLEFANDNLVHEAYTESGQRILSTVVGIVGDFDDSGNGTKIRVDDAAKKSTFTNSVSLGPNVISLDSDNCVVIGTITPYTTANSVTSSSGSLIVGDTHIINNALYSAVIGYGCEVTGSFDGFVAGTFAKSNSFYQIAMGRYAEADTAYYANSIGLDTIANQTSMMAVGQANIIRTAGNSINNTSNALFVVGNGTVTTSGGITTINSADVRSDAFEVIMSGNVNAPSLTIALIDAEATGKTLITKEWINAQTFTGDLQAVTDIGNTTTNSISIGPGTNTLPSNTVLAIGQDIPAAHRNSIFLSGEQNGAFTNNITAPEGYQGNNLLISDVYLGKTTSLKNQIFSSIVSGFGNVAGVDNVGFGINNFVVYASLISGIDNELTAGKAAALIGTGLKSGASRALVVGSHNRDITQTKGTVNTNSSSAYNPRFIVGTSTNYNENGKTGTPMNGFVVMSDGHVSAPRLTTAMIDTPTIPTMASGTTDGTTANKLVDSTKTFLSTVMVGDIVRNTTDTTTATVTAVDSDTTLSLDADIMISGENYVIDLGFFADRTLITREWFNANTIVPTLQVVTDAGNTTTNGISIINDAATYLQATNVAVSNGFYAGTDGSLGVYNGTKAVDISTGGTVQISITNAAGHITTLTTTATAGRSISFPDASGTLALASDIITYTASNGLTKSVNDIQLGGNLSTNTSIVGADNTLTFTCSNAFNPGFLVNKTGGSSAIRAQNSGTPTIAAIESFMNSTNTNSVIPGFSLVRNTTGTAANGIGIGITFGIENDSGAGVEAGNIDLFLSDVTNGSIDSTMRFRVASNNAQVNALDISGTEVSSPFNISGLSFNNLSLFAQTGVDVDNIGIGINALNSNSGTDAVAIGTSALQNNTANSVTAVGRSAGQSNSGGFATVIGAFAGLNNTGNNLTAIGYSAGSDSTGFDNVFMGRLSGANSASDNSVAVGVSAGRFTVKDDGVFIGDSAGIYNRGLANVNIGLKSGEFSTNDNSVFIGHWSGRYEVGLGNTVIGHNSNSTFNDDVANLKNVASAATDVDTVLNRITITAHGFGATNSYVILKYSTTGTPIGGLNNGLVYQFQIIDANTIQYVSNLSSVGTDTHTFTPQFIYNNVTVLGASAEATKSNQVTLGDSNITEVKTSGTYVSGGYTVATLPTGVTGARAYVTDSNVTASGNFGATVAGGGANVVPVFYDGSNWIIA